LEGEPGPDSMELPLLPQHRPGLVAFDFDLRVFESAVLCIESGVFEFRSRGEAGFQRAEPGAFREQRLPIPIRLLFRRVTADGRLEPELAVLDDPLAQRR